MTIIIECNGLPGCGKTTFIEQFSRTLRENKIYHKTIGVKTFRGTALGFKRLLLLFQRISPLLSHPRLLVRAFFPTSKVNNYPFLTLKERLITQMYLYYLLGEYENADCLLLTDEGVVQTLTTLSEYTNLSPDNCPKAFMWLERKERVGIDCTISIEADLTRWEDRNRKDSAIDFLSKNEILKYLNLFAADLQGIRCVQSNRIEVNMEEDYKKAFASIIEKMEKIV